MTPDKSKRTLLILSIFLIFILSIGMTIRVTNIGKPGLGTDESFHVFAAKSLIETGKPDLPSGYTYKRALLYTKIVAISYKIFGVSEFSARLPSAVFGSLTIILIFFVGKTFFGTATGVISAILFAFSPFAIVWARECRMYSMFQFFYLLGSWAFYKGFESHRHQILNEPNNKKHRHKAWAIIKGPFGWGWDLKWLFAACILFFISMKLQSLTALFGASLVTYLVLMATLAFTQNSAMGEPRNKYLFTLGILFLGGIVVFVAKPDLLSLLKYLFFFAPNWSAGMSFNPLYYLTFLGSKAVFPIGAFFAVGSIQIILRANKPGIYSLVCVIIPLAILTFIPSNVRGTRYIYHIYPIIILIAGYSLSLLCKYEFNILTDLLKEKKIGIFAPVVIGAITASFFLFFAATWGNYLYRFTKDYYHEEVQLGTPYRNWKDACKYVSEYMSPEDIIITTEPLAATFYNCGDIQYVLTNNPKRKKMHIKGTGNINDLAGFKKVLSENERGWIVIDAGRFNTRRYLRKDIRDYLTQNLGSYIIDPHGTMLVFYWNNDSSIN